jgi:uncharacterized membrane protein
MQFPGKALDAIEQAIASVELAHQGEIRFAIETALSPLHILNGVPPRVRALEVFAQLRVWDTEQNNGVLIYVQMADRNVEIIADRGFEGRVSLPEWEAVCRLMEEHFRARRFEAGAVAGVLAIGDLMARHFPRPSAPASQSHNQLPDRPILL